MKNKILVSLFGLFIISVCANAQTFKDELDVVQTMWGKDKKALANEFLALTPEESAKFSPIYEEYLVGRKKVGLVRAEALEAYAKANAQLDDAMASKMVTTLMKNNTSLAKLQTKTFKKMSKTLSPVKAAQWWQLESYLDAEIRSAILGELPFIQPMKK
jgi:hypothetical protein